MIKRTLLTVVAAAGLALAASAPALAAQPYPINFKNFPLGSYASISGVTESGGTVTLASTGLGSFTYTDPFANYSNDGANGSGPYQSGTWTSPDYSTSFGFNELVASWNATTPNGTWIQVEMQPKMLDGHWAVNTRASILLAPGPRATATSTARRSAVRATRTASSRSTRGSPRTTSRSPTG